ncbi:MAG: hypothetical protein AAGK32_11925 [Actinomycetota bacterium]
MLGAIASPLDLTRPPASWDYLRPHVVLVAAASPDNAAGLARTAAQLAVEPNSSIVALHIEDARSTVAFGVGRASPAAAVERVVAVAGNYGVPCTVQTVSTPLDWCACRRRRQVAAIIERWASEVDAERIVVGTSRVLPMAMSVAHHLRARTSIPIVEVSADENGPGLPALGQVLRLVHR